MNKRERILLAMVVVILFLLSAESLITETILQPLDEREARVADLEQRIQANDRSFTRIQVAQKQQKNLAVRSLPADPSVASTLYQNWLLETAADSGLDEVIVTPHRVVPESDAFVRFPFSIQASTTLKGLCEFMHSFDQAELLQKITQVSVESNDRSRDPRLQITVHLEAIALDQAEPRTTLFPDSESHANAEPDEEKNYDALLQRNFFVRGYGGPNLRSTASLVQKNKKPKPKPVDFGAQTYLIASLLTDGKREAWLFDRTCENKIVLFEGSPFAVAEFTGRVATIERDHVIVEIEGVTKKLDLGRNFRQLINAGNNEF